MRQKDQNPWGAQQSSSQGLEDTQREGPRRTCVMNTAGPEPHRQMQGAELTGLGWEGVGRPGGNEGGGESHKQELGVHELSQQHLPVFITAALQQAWKLGS